MTPTDQTSTAFPYGCCSKTSGAGMTKRLIMDVTQ